MKQLLATQFTADNDTFTQVKRSDTAALYKRETPEGTLVSYEVFATLAKGDVEIYPKKHAFGKWAWCPISLDRAETYFKRINNGDVAIPLVDPETSEVVSLENDPTLDEAMLQPETVKVSLPARIPHVVHAEVQSNDGDGDTPLERYINFAVDTVTKLVETSEKPVLDIPVDITEDLATIVPITPDVNVSVLPPLKPKGKRGRKPKATSYLIPSGNFKRAEFAKLNGMHFEPPDAVSFIAMTKEIEAGRIKEVGKEPSIGRGRPKSIYSAV